MAEIWIFYQKNEKIPRNPRTRRSSIKFFNQGKSSPFSATFPELGKSTDPLKTLKKRRNKTPLKDYLSPCPWPFCAPCGYWPRSDQSAPRSSALLTKQPEIPSAKSCVHRKLAKNDENARFYFILRFERKAANSRIARKRRICSRIIHKSKKKAKKGAKFISKRKKLKEEEF